MRSTPSISILFTLLLTTGSQANVCSQGLTLFCMSSDRLGGVWGLLRIGGALPKSLRDALYNLIARNRYSIFGKYDVCLMPEERYRKKFLDDPRSTRLTDLSEHDYRRASIPSGVCRNCSVEAEAKAPLSGCHSMRSTAISGCSRRITLKEFASPGRA